MLAHITLAAVVKHADTAPEDAFPNLLTLCFIDVFYNRVAHEVAHNTLEVFLNH
jgi:hypothetical protein